MRGQRQVCVHRVNGKEHTFRTGTSSETLKHFDIARFHKLMSCRVQCSSQIFLLSKLGKKKKRDLIQCIKHLVKRICTEIPAGFLFTQPTAL